MTNTFQYDSDGQLAIGSPAPDFNLPGVDGETYTLEQYRDKVKGLVVIFTCNHCPYVIKTEERMIVLGREYIDKGIGFVLISANDAINYPQDSFANMKKRSDQKSFPFPYLYNEDQTVARAYGAQVTPHLFFFDSDLKLCYRGSIDDNMDNANRPTKQYLKDAIEAVLSNSTLTDEKTRAVGCSVKWK